METVAHSVISLYPDEKIPNALRRKDAEEENEQGKLTKVSRPSLTVYLPEVSNGIGIIVCPGGGYHTLVIKREGYKLADALVKIGYAVFVLKYRLPSDEWMQNKSIGPVQDAQQAIRLVRQNATAWNLHPEKIGIMGFSAGGHLAATAGTHFGKAYIDNKEGISLRPDFMVLIYPVISMSDELAHQRSKNNLLGANPDAATVAAFSNELQVTAETPPTFLIHTQDDTVVDVRNSLVFYEALVKHKVPSALHVYPHGEHGLGIDAPFDYWLSICEAWMQQVVKPAAKK
jgi:acetyl esterase/lipase